MVSIKIWSDLMCPFCYIGKAHLNTALEQLGIQDQVEVEWKSFQLDPTLPEESILMKDSDYFTKRKGFAPDQVAQMHENVAQMGKAAGVEMNFDKVFLVNSTKAHCVLKLAKERGLSNEAQELLFKAYFTEGKDLGDLAQLAGVVSELGITEAEIAAALQDESILQEIQQDIHEAQQVGVRGVPFFVFQDKYALSGAQPVESFKEVIEHIRKEEALTTTADSAGSCSIDGCD